LEEWLEGRSGKVIRRIQAAAAGKSVNRRVREQEVRRAN